MMAVSHTTQVVETRADWILLEDTFTLHDKNEPCRVVLRTNGLEYAGNRISLEDIVGCHCMREKGAGTCRPGRGTDGPTDPAFICVYSYPLKRKLLGKGMRRVRQAVIFKIDRGSDHQANVDTAERWRNTLVRLVRRAHNPSEPVGLAPPVRRLLVFVNPHSGPGKALQIFHQRVVPILAEADIPYQLFISDRANHVREHVRTMELQGCHGLVIVSGDGLLFELINGLMEREDWQRAITIPIGVVPGGSGNGLARAIGHALGEPYIENMVLTSSLNLVSGLTRPMDLVRVQLPQQTLYSFLSVGWGIMADIDIESEKLRAIGEPRFTLWAVARVIGLRSYRGKVSFLPVEGCKYEPKSTQHVTLSRSSTLDLDVKSATESIPYTRIDKVPTRFSQSANIMTGSKSANNMSDNVSDAVSALEECGLNDQIDVCWPADDMPELSNPRTPVIETLLPPLDEPVPDNWVVVEGEFVLVYVAYQTHLGSDCFFAPQARLDDGIMWLVIINKGISRVQLASFLLGLESGEHVLCPYADVVPVTAFRIEPYSEGGYVTVDGEEVDYGPVQGEVVPSICNVMVH